MFESLTNRERKLAYATLTLVPISLLFIGFFWFLGAYNANIQELGSLSTAFDSAKDEELAGMRANRRRNYYNSISLPPAYGAATNEYQSWLKQLMKKSDLEFGSFDSLDAGTLQTRMGGELIGRRKSFSIQAKGNLQQLNDFLTEFYSVDLMHRIDSLKIIPLTEGTGKKKVRTGLLSLLMKVEVVSLSNAENRELFTEAKRALARDAKEYESILRRNIFGPANNPPQLSIRSSSVTTGNRATVNITAKDNDANDLLSFELVKSSVDGVKLEPIQEGDRRARFYVPSQEPGTYEFEVRVFDNGLPAKETVEVCKVTFREPPPPKADTVKVEPPPKPKYKNAEQTRVTGIVKNSKGVWQTFVVVRTTGQRYCLSVGDTFELDEQEWVVSQIKKDEVTFKAGDKTYVARPNPQERGKLIEVSKAL